MLPTPRQVFKEQFCDADASMLSIMQTLQNPCQMQGYLTLLAVGTLQSLPRRGSIVSCSLQHEHRLRGVNDKACHIKLRFAFGIQCHYNTLRVDVSYIAVVTTYNCHTLEHGGYRCFGAEHYSDTHTVFNGFVDERLKADNTTV
jgi:hypothetical protein